jgi:hypothetical protein
MFGTLLRNRQVVWSALATPQGKEPLTWASMELS